MTAVQPVPGAAGAAGTSGGGLGVDVWASQATPASVTDWGAVINSLITGGAKRLNFTAHDYPITTQINLNNKYALSFMGEGGGIHPTVGGTSDLPTARLIWKNGAASGIAITMNGSDGIEFSNLGLLYDNAAYNGDLISCDYSTSQTASALFERCQIGYINWSGVVAARSLLRWTNAVSCTARECAFNGAQSAIRGFETTDSGGQATGSQHPDNDRVVHCTFRDCANAFITNIGRYWTIEDNEFLFGSLQSVATVTGITSDISCGSDFSYERNRNWDFVNTTQKAIYQPSIGTWTARIRGNFFDTHAATNIDLAGPGSVSVEDNSFARQVSTTSNPLVDLGASGTAYKSYARIRGNSWSASSNPSIVIANITGHGMLDIGPNSENQGFEAYAPQIGSLGGVERARWSTRYLPTVSLAAGQPAIVVDGKTQDGFGYLTFTTPAGSPSVAGKLATVTFGQPLVKGHGQGIPDAVHQVALVLLSPYGISNDSVAVANSISCGFFAQVTGSQSTSFDIYTANAIPAGSVKVGVAYRVVSM